MNWPAIFPRWKKAVFAIRRFRDTDLPAVIRMVQETFNEQYDPQMYQNLFSGWPDGFLIAEYDNQVKGFLLGMVSAPGQIRVLLLAVQPGERSKGEGARLMWTFMKNGSVLGANSITLEVRASNARGIAFYNRLGFAFTGMIPGYYKDGEGAHVMGRLLR